MIEPAINGVLARWETFLGKVQGRVDEVMAEADAGFDEVMAVELIDPAPMSGASSAFDARVRGLAKKIEEAWEKLEREIDALIDAGQDALCDVRNRESERARETARAIEERAAILRSRKEAQAARLLGELAVLEMKQPRQCPQCGAELVRTTPHRAESVTCKFCRAVNSVVPGMPTAMYFGGGAMHQLGHDAALEQWVAMEHEERRYKAIREPAEPDLQRFEAATLAYWRTYVDAIGRLNPDWDPATVEAQLRGKMGHFHAWATRERQDRDR